MEGFTIIDGVVALVVILSALLAYGRGLVREIMAIAGWVIAAIAAFMLAPQVEPLVKEIPYVADFIGDNCELAMVGAFAIVFTAALVIVSLFVPLFSSAVQRSALGGIDQGLGFLFGVARGLLLVAIAFFIYQTIIPPGEYTVVDDSRSVAVFTQFTDRIAAQDPQQALGWLTDQYEGLISSCEAQPQQ